MDMDYFRFRCSDTFSGLPCGDHVRCAHCTEHITDIVTDLSVADLVERCTDHNERCPAFRHVRSFTSIRQQDPLSDT